MACLAMALDEATSHLDIANEQRVTQALVQMSLTRIVVAHPPETIAGAQRVVGLQRGKVLEVAVVGDVLMRQTMEQ